MVTHARERRGEKETRRRGDAATRRNPDRCVDIDCLRVSASLVRRVTFILRLSILAGILFGFACGSKATDPKTVIPADALVYLESSDLSKTLAAITENPKFQQLAKTKPDLSALDGVKVAIAVTGFETSEQTVTDENSVLNFQPRFVAVAETNAWGWQAKSFVENQLGEFVNGVYDGVIELEITTRADGEFYVWKSADGRKAYALQQGSLVFFGNDESAIERCQAVKRGEAESIANNSKITDGERLAFGYISPEGVGQIANIAGISFAIGASEEEEVKSFVARVLPEVLRNSIKDLTWIAVRSDSGIEDKFVAGLDEETARVFSETLAPATAGTTELSGYIPPSAASTTRYLLKEPQVAWRSVLLTTQKKTDETSGLLIAAFASRVFEPYGVEEPEVFLSAVGGELYTAKLTPDSEDVVVLATIKDAAKVRNSLAKEINFGRPAESQLGGSLWKSEDGELAAAIVGEAIIVGDAASVIKCLEARHAGPSAELARQLAASDAVSTTVGSETGSLDRLVDVFAERKSDGQVTPLAYRTETRFNKNGVERRTISDFGLIGWLIERMAVQA